MKTPSRFSNLSERTLRISAASVLAVVMMSSAYLLSGPNFLTSRSANAESSEELLKAYASKDTDADGLPDWQESLYGTDPNKVISNSFGISDGQAAQEGKLTPSALASQLPDSDQGTTTPLTDADFDGTPAPAAGSITEQFSREFLLAYVQASDGKPMDENTKNALIQNLLSNVAARSSQLFASTYRSVDVHTSTDTSVTIYTAQLESALTTHDLSEDESDPVAIMEALIVKDDTSARAKLINISNAYAAMASDMRSAKVPPSLSAVQVDIVKSLDQLSRTTKTISDYTKDPVGALGAMTAFNESTKLFAANLSTLANVLLQSGEPQAGASGALIVRIVRMQK